MPEKAERKQMAESTLTEVGLARQHGSTVPTNFRVDSGREVAIARALVNSPALLLADEPTGNLDSKISEEIMETFCRNTQERKHFGDGYPRT